MTEEVKVSFELRVMYGASPWNADEAVVTKNDFTIHDGEMKQAGSHFVSYKDGKLFIFGNQKPFPAPIGWAFSEAAIHLVPNGTIPLPEGQVNIFLPDGSALKPGDVVPSVDYLEVRMPNAQGRSNWAGPQLVFTKPDQTPCT